MNSNAKLSRTVTLRTGETVTFAVRWDELTEGVRATLENAAADAVYAPKADDPEFYDRIAYYLVTPPKEYLRPLTPEDRRYEAIDWAERVNASSYRVKHDAQYAARLKALAF